MKAHTDSQAARQPIENQPCNQRRPAPEKQCRDGGKMSDYEKSSRAPIDFGWSRRGQGFTVIARFHSDPLGRFLLTIGGRFQDTRLVDSRVYLPRRGRNERTVLLCLRAKGTTDFAVVVVGVCNPAKPSGTTRFTFCPVSRSIARIDRSSTGATIVIALP